MKLFMMSRYGHEQVDHCFKKIQDLIVKSLEAVQKCVINDDRCFELYGFDVMIDDDFKPWLIEVNS